MLKPTIVVADDYGPMLETISCWLEGSFDVVARVSSGSAAIEAVEALKPDILIMDVAMPDTSGPEAARYLRNCHTATKVILVSAAVESDADWGNLGARAYVHKARMRSDLIIAIQEVLAGRTYFPRAVGF
jgi:DNA-binding NarL/FixJ family response regulator